jgi:hypothetical protein
MHPVNPSLVTDGTTFVNPLGLCFTLVMGILVVALPRRYAMVPVILLVCYMTMGMRIMIANLNFTMIRLLLMCAWARLVIRGELRRLELNSIDKIIIFYVISGIVTYALLWQSFDALKWRLGAAYNDLGFYFFFRFLIRKKEDAIRCLKMFAVIILPLAAAMVQEKLTGRNMFAALGGVPPLTFVRDGALRCEGPFAHPILAGTFGATLMPLFVGLWQYDRKARLFAALAVVATILITVMSASSGPVLSLMAGAFALALWSLRHNMQKIRWAISMVIIGLHIVMKAPVWFLIGRIDVFNGSTGYHRALLIDRCIANFWGWWLVGTKSTWAWADKDDHLFDVTNQYILSAANGGLITMVLFIAVIVLCFKATGRTVRLDDRSGAVKDARFMWAVGAALFTHAISFMSVSYFDQNFVNWYMLLAFISVLAGSSLAVSRRTFFQRLRLARGLNCGSSTTAEEREKLIVSDDLLPGSEFMFGPTFGK